MAWPAILDVSRQLDQAVRVMRVLNGQVIPVVGYSDRPYGVGVNAVSKFPTCAVGKFPSTDMVISH
ncbi:hypothetical protein, partial [Komagataeibacter intermedius]|uniref:hypothetical protein n=1 Tax=Komagataeibacter intermedius TaxID=66229 RepID=UPI0024A8FBC7